MRLGGGGGGIGLIDRGPCVEWCGPHKRDEDDDDPHLIDAVNYIITATQLRGRILAGHSYGPRLS